MLSHSVKAQERSLSLLYSADQTASTIISTTSSTISPRASKTHCLRDLESISSKVSIMLQSLIWIHHKLASLELLKPQSISALESKSKKISKMTPSSSTTKRWKSPRISPSSSTRLATPSTTLLTTTICQKRSRRVGSKPRPSACSISTSRKPSSTECNIISIPHLSIPSMVSFLI